MKVKITAYILPHIGDKYFQCADRFSYSEADNCFAIADGVGNSLFPDAWADIVCEDFISHPNVFDEGGTLVRENALIAKWEQERNDRVAEFSEDERFIYEMGLEKADYAACTFVGLTLMPEKWRCVCIGDTYLVTLNERFEVIHKIASMAGHDFDFFPEYVASSVGKNNGSLIVKEGTYENVAYCLLMTDALSDWCLSEATTTEQRRQLVNISSHEDFETFVGEERRAGRMKDDDTTMLVLKIVDNGENRITYEKGLVDDIKDLIQIEENQMNQDAVATR